MLISQLFSESADLELIAAGGRRMLVPESSASVALVQQALLAIGFPLKAGGVDGAFGQETGDAVVAFKTDRALFPNDPVVGTGTIKRLDREVAWHGGKDIAFRDWSTRVDQIATTTPALGCESRAEPRRALEMHPLRPDHK